MSRIQISTLHEDAWFNGRDYKRADILELRLVFCEAARAKGWAGAIETECSGFFATAEGDGAEVALAAGEQAVANWVHEIEGCE